MIPFGFHVLKVFTTSNFWIVNLWQKKNSLTRVQLSISLLHIELGDKGVNLNDLLKRVVDIGDKTFLWKDTSCGDMALKYRGPNSYIMETNKDCKVVERVNGGRGGDMEAWWNWS